MIEWMRWVRRALDGGFYPSSSPMFRDYRAPEWSEGPPRSLLVVIDDPRAEEVEMAVCLLRQRYPHYHQAVIVHWFGDWMELKTDGQRAGWLGCAETAYKMRRNCGHLFIDARLSR
jgi:hypothetical protein